MTTDAFPTGLRAVFNVWGLGFLRLGMFTFAFVFIQGLTPAFPLGMFIQFHDLPAPVRFFIDQPVVRVSSASFVHFDEVALPVVSGVFRCGSAAVRFVYVKRRRCVVGASFFRWAVLPPEGCCGFLAQRGRDFLGEFHVPFDAATATDAAAASPATAAPSNAQEQGEHHRECREPPHELLIVSALLSGALGLNGAVGLPDDR